MDSVVSDVNTDNGESSVTEGATASDTFAASKPTCIIVLGMAGSGKTTFVQRLSTYLSEKTTPAYIINLDPATHDVPYPANIDIRDSVKYKDVMKQYSLGPNGAIMTSLNLFTIRCFNQVMNLIEKRSQQVKYVILDTPGQIEVFTWSASGSIITGSLASSFPTVVVYVMDTVRSYNPVTFMSNMLYACSILYRTKLPMVVAMNKTDVIDHSFAIRWMTDFDEFLSELDKESSYTSNLTRSMCLVLDQFYQDLKTVGVSAAAGTGMVEFFEAIDSAASEFQSHYMTAQKINKKLTEEQESELQRLRHDLGETEDSAGTSGKEPILSRINEMYLAADGGESDDDSDLERNDDDDDDVQEKLAEASFKRFVSQKKTLCKLSEEADNVMATTSSQDKSKTT